MKKRSALLLALATAGGSVWAQDCSSGGAPSAITPSINVGGTSAWQASTTATVNAGARVALAPQAAAGAWSWEGCGTSGSAREQFPRLSTSCTATVTHTNSCGSRVTRHYTFNVIPAPGPNVGRHIVVDQFGYRPGMKKVAVLRAPVSGFDAGQSYTPGETIEVVNVATGAVASSGSAVAWNAGATDPSSGDRAWRFDFSALTAPGIYQIVDPQHNQRSVRFEIGDNVYRPLLVQAVRAMFYQRAGGAKPAANAGLAWADGASHLGPGQDTQARRFLAQGDASTARDLRGGWYDAGDPNKYTGWAASYVQDLLFTYAQKPSIWTDDFNIPESGNGIPDVLDEAKWGLDWLVRMQNSDGAMLSIVGLASGSPPSAAAGPSFWGDPNTSATLASAAAFAQAARVYGALGHAGLAGFAADLRQRAIAAWNWAAANPSVIFRNNDAASGTAGLGAGQQETDDAGRAALKVHAAIELFALTGEARYREHVDAHYASTSQMFTAWWIAPFNNSNTRSLLAYASLPGATPAVAAAIRSRYLDLWGRRDYGGWGALDRDADPYRAHLSAYTWGSNGVKALAGQMFVDEALSGINRRPLAEVNDAAAAYLHYLHGTNPLGKVYLTNMNGFGAENSANQVFHFWFNDGSPRWDDAATSLYGPAPGILVGGPNNDQWDWDARCPGISPACGSTRPAPPWGQPPQKAFLDFNAGWPLNAWPITENGNGYQTAYIRLLSRFVD